jgi:hypothetical protein
MFKSHYCGSQGLLEIMARQYALKSSPPTMCFFYNACSDALSACGLSTLAAAALWSLGTSYTSVMVALLELLANAASSSKAMRASWVLPGVNRCNHVGQQALSLQS